MTDGARVAVVIPAYNEASVIADVIKQAKKVFAKSPYRAEIVVVDDGSTDQTAQTAKATGAKVIQHILNTGSGGATATGLSWADSQNFDIAVTLDADGQHEAEDALRGIKAMLAGQADLLIGSRLLERKAMSPLKKLGNKGLSVVTFLLFGVNVTDSQSGLRIFSRRALKELKWKTSGYEFCSEMLWRAKQQRLVIGEFPIRAIYSDYSRSKGQNNWNGFNIVKFLLRQRLVEFFSE